MTTVEQRLRDALFDEADGLDESDDLFARVALSIDDDRTIRRQRRTRIGIIGCLLGAIAAVVFATTERTKGELVMDWWVLELMWFAGMVFLALWLGPFIRRFGKSYAADVFRANPRTGKSFIVLMDVAYYLIFFAFILFTVQFEPDAAWGQTVNAAQLRACTVRLGWHPPHRRSAARAQRADAADHRAHPHAEPSPRRGDPAPGTARPSGLTRSDVRARADPGRRRAGGALDARLRRDRAAQRRAARGTERGARRRRSVGRSRSSGAACSCSPRSRTLLLVGLGGSSDDDRRAHRRSPRRPAVEAAHADDTATRRRHRPSRRRRSGPELPSSVRRSGSRPETTEKRSRRRTTSPTASSPTPCSACTCSASSRSPGPRRAVRRRQWRGRCGNQIPVQFDDDGEARFQYLVSNEFLVAGSCPATAGPTPHRARSSCGRSRATRAVRSRRSSSTRSLRRGASRSHPRRELSLDGERVHVDGPRLPGRTPR